MKNLLVELQSVTQQKRKILRKVKTEEELQTKLSYDERQILKHLDNKENEILMNLVELKGWNINSEFKQKKQSKHTSVRTESSYYRPKFYNF